MNIKNINPDAIRKVALANKDRVKKFVVDNLPNIFSCGAVASLGGAVYLTAVGMHRADDILAAEEKRFEETLPEYDGTELTFARKAELVWKEFVPAGIATLASGIFIVASNRAGHEKYMGMLGAYELTKKAFDDYRGSAEDILGEEKAQEIDNQAAIKRAEFPAGCVINAIPNVDNSPNPTLFVEYYTGAAFYASQETVYHAFNYANNKRNHYEAVSVGEMLEDMSVDTSMIHGADTFYWKSFDQKEYCDMLEPRWEAGFFNGNKAMPCTVIGYNIPADTVQTEHYWM